MKKIICFLVGMLFQQFVFGQYEKSFSVDVSLGRYAIETSLFTPDYYTYSTTLLTGINVGYHPSRKWKYHLGFRRIDAPSVFSTGFTSLESDLKGVEFTMGVTLSPEANNKIFVSYGIEMFGEITQIEGVYVTDYSGPNDVQHRKNYFGIAPNVALNFQVSNKMLIFVHTRYRFGKVSIDPDEINNSGSVPFSDRRFWMGVFEPINSIGIRYRL